MSRIYDYVVVGTVSAISYVIHFIAVTLFAPGTDLYDIAASATAFSGGERAEMWFQVLAIWTPAIAIAGICAWALFREYRRQSVTRPAPR